MKARSKLFQLIRSFSVMTFIFTMPVVVLAGLAVVASAAESEETLSSTAKDSVASQRRLEWNRQTLVGAYDRVGKADPRWNESAHTALGEFARGRMSGQMDGKLIARACEQAMGAGCDDPLVIYLHARYAVATTEQLTALRRAAQGMMDSRYPAIRKFYACMRASEPSVGRWGTIKKASAAGLEMRHRAVGYLSEALADKTMPIEEVYDACLDILEGSRADPPLHEEAYRAIEKPLFENWPTNHIPHLIKGLYYMNYAWFARGTGFADSVRDEGWKLFGQRLDRAEEAFETAWKMNPSDVRIAEEMLRKEQSQSRGRERMELWFGRAMALDTNSYTACNAKRYYLEPKWYGSPEELLAFGRECVQSTNWGGRVPLILAEAHEALSTYLPAPGREKYWKDPKVWPDVKASYEKYLTFVPQSVTGPSKLVRYAYMCELWDEFNQRVARLSTTNYAVFGGKEKFEAMVSAAKERVGQAKDTPKQ